MTTLDIVRAQVEVMEIAEQIKSAPPGTDMTLLDRRLETLKQKLIADIDERIAEIDRESV